MKFAYAAAAAAAFGAAMAAATQAPARPDPYSFKLNGAPLTVITMSVEHELHEADPCKRRPATPTTRFDAIVADPDGKLFRVLTLGGDLTVEAGLLGPGKLTAKGTLTRLTLDTRTASSLATTHIVVDLTDLQWK